ncbi:chromatin assembly factor 1 subunit A-like [Vanessa atalanta]|uniref:chromatin assembly factor 1 subunit A-like n=1 Tax=Vanessa atalanta TaxID=42275 RepID=UPI001FCDDFF2|nr:chromatin assembly factor 1 subunit A-like [Vanessa atalanta]
MKTQKSSDNEEVTPTKKVLKQARLPFMIISDVSPKSVATQSRKRKLSVPEPEPVTKVGKISKEDDSAQELVVISDDDSKEHPQATKSDKQLNPYVKLVDTAWKKKAQKAKNVKKKKTYTKKSKKIANTSAENDENTSEPSNENGDSKNDKVEEMEVSESEEIHQEVEEINDEATKNDDDNEPPSPEMECEKDNILTVEDSCSEDIKSQNVENNSNDKDCSSSKDEDNLHANTEKNDETSEPETNIKELNNSSTVTPKRSQRNQSKAEDKNSSIISNCDESFSSNPSTPRRSTRQVSLTNSQGDISLNESNSKITPKQLQKKLESAKKKEEREKEKTEREKKKQQEKDERARQRQEKEEQKKREREEKEEAKKKEKEEKEEQKRKEREEKEKQKELEKKMREEKEEQKRKEKEEKEEQKKKEKEAREEEKRKKQEALEQEKLEQEQKKKKAAEAFVSFFVPKQKGEREQVTLGTISNKDILSSFTIKSDMRLAPTTRVTLDEESRKVFDNYLEEQNVPESSLYIKSLKGSHKPQCNGKTWPLSDRDDDDVMIVEDELLPVDGAGETIACDIVKREKLRPKLFAFHENRRPPYWGTWRKKSKFINPRKPFKTDEKLLDYEVDSDEEWEEEQEGESIDGSAAGSDDEQDADEYEVDNEVFVPHGYLSDEEATMDEDDVLSLSPETQKARLKHLEDEFEFEMKKPMEKLKPRLYGLLWETADGSRPENCADALWNYFGKLSMIMNDPTPFLQPSNESEDTDKKKAKKKKTTDGDQKSPKNEKKKKSKIEDKEIKKPKIDTKKTTQDNKKNQPGINTFLTKIKT